MIPRFSASRKSSPQGPRDCRAEGRTRQAGLAAQSQKRTIEHRLLPPWAILCLSPRLPDHLSRAFPDVAFTGAKTLGKSERLGESPVGPGAGRSQAAPARTRTLCTHAALCPGLGCHPRGLPLFSLGLGELWGDSGMVGRLLVGPQAFARVFQEFEGLKRAGLQKGKVASWASACR